MILYAKDKLYFDDFLFEIEESGSTSKLCHSFVFKTQQGYQKKSGFSGKTSEFGKKKFMCIQQ